jgi:hypothetical protein
VKTQNTQKVNSIKRLTPSPSLTHLTFGYTFNQRVDALPPSLTHLLHLTFGQCFDQPVDALPLSLTHLTFGASFHHAVDKLPSYSPISSLQALGISPDHLTLLTLPASLCQLKAHADYLRELNGYIPASCTIQNI